MKILLVEDARAIATVMTARLQSFGHEVILAENGKIAVEKYQKANPDLILMDIEMPIMNGFEATNQIREHEATLQWAWTPILFLTASDTSENLITAIEAGADDFLSKTLPEPVLHAKMKAMVRIAALRQKLSAANRKLHELAMRDGLTGLFNRRHMDMLLDAEWKTALQKRSPFGILLLDIDNFKKYNDHYGHQTGDDCLRKVAQALHNATESANSTRLTQGAFTARYGGEEFALVIPNASVDSCESIAGSVLDAVRDLGIPHAKNADWGIVTTSIGCAYLNVASDTIAGIFRTADTCLYRAKNNGRNRVEFG